MNLNARAPGTPGDLSIDPSVWGPHVWATLHTLALKADADLEITAFNNFLNSLLFLLPCSSCKHDFSKYVSAHGYPELATAFDWTVKLHNHVNAKLGKPSLTVDEAYASWFSDSCSYTCKNTKQTSTNDKFAFILVGLIVVIILARYVRF
jgi:hypothetical protein